MGLEHFIKTNGAIFFYNVGLTSKYPSLEDFLTCDEPSGMNWRAFGKRDGWFRTKRTLWLSGPVTILLVGQFLLCQYIHSLEAALTTKAAIVNIIILLMNLFYDGMMMWIGE